MIVVADTSPINYLVHLQLDTLLFRLYGQVRLPLAVHRELSAPGAPNEVRVWATELPAWVIVLPDRSNTRQELEHLDSGERAAIEEALQLKADILLVDERAGTYTARELGLITVGTLGVLAEAENAGLLDALATYERLCSETRFRRDKKFDKLFLNLLIRQR